MRNWLPMACTALFLGAATMVACSSGDSSTAPSSATLTVELTDAPADDVTAINVYITGLTVKPIDGPIERISNDVGLVDILTLRGVSMILVTTGLDPGAYDHIRIELDETRSTVVEKVGGQEKPLKIASQEIKVNGGFTIQERRDTIVSLDFDAQESLHRRGNGEWLLVPIIVQEKVVQE